MMKPTIVTYSGGTIPQPGVDLRWPASALWRPGEPAVRSIGLSDLKEAVAKGIGDFNAGGAVAFASATYLLLSIVLGLVERFLKPPLWLSTIIFVPATFALSYLGTKFSTVLLLDHMSWGVLILIYCVVASLVPVWALLQPRGYLGGFVLYTAIAIGVIGIFFGGYEIAQPAFKSWDIGGMTGMLFPFLFVTIACGACSGFHGLVCSGTTSKQIDKESHTKSVGYGAMLAEGFVAFIALVTIMIVAQAGLLGSNMQTPVDASYLADTVIALRYFEAEGKIRRAISVIKKRSGAHEDQLREFTLGRPGIRVGEPLDGYHGVFTGVPTPLQRPFQANDGKHRGP